MRIGLCTWGARRVGGAEGYLAALIPALREAGHEVALFTEQDGPADRSRITRDPAVPVWTAATGGRERAIAALRAWRPDVLYTHGMLDPGFERALLDVAPATCFAHSYYGLCITGTRTLQWPTVRPCPYRFGPACLVRYYPRRIGGLNPVTMVREYGRQRDRLDLLAAYRYVITHSAYLADAYRRHGLLPDRVRQVPFFVPAPAQPAPDAPDPDPWHLLYVGRMDRVKGGQVALDALPAVADRLGRVHLTFAGDGPERRRWQEHAARHVGEDSRITTSFEGWLHGDRLERAWANAHLLVMPSLWPEPFGVAGVEAAWHGRPAAAFDVGGISEWLTGGRTGHLAPAHPPTAGGLAEAVVRCLASRDHYADLCRGARAAAQRFARERHLDALLPLLREAAG